MLADVGFGPSGISACAGSKERNKMTILQPDTLTEERIPVDEASFGIRGGRPAGAPIPKLGRKLLIWISTAALFVAAVVTWKSMSGPAAPAYVTVNVTRGDLAKTISATGKVQAVTTVQVGTQV